MTKQKKITKQPTEKQTKLIAIAKKNETAIAVGEKGRTKSSMLREAGYEESQMREPSRPFAAPIVKSELDKFKEKLNNKIESAAMIQVDQMNDAEKAKEAKLGENVAAFKALHGSHRLENNESTGNIEVIVPQGVPDAFIKRMIG